MDDEEGILAKLAQGWEEIRSRRLEPRLYFVVGPLRTGSSLLTRCLDDHPEAICLCESEINRALYQDYFVAHHFQRMAAHGLTFREALYFIDRRKQDDIDALQDWYWAVSVRLAELYEKPELAALGDKSPDFYRSPELVCDLAARYPLIYTVRDPRAIYWSIESQIDPSLMDKAERWGDLLRNYVEWRPYLDAGNVHVVRYEDLVAAPGPVMEEVYAHLGLRPSSRFLTAFRRPYPERFLWPTAVDWETGVARDFDTSRVDLWKTGLPARQRAEVCADPVVADFMRRFGYER